MGAFRTALAQPIATQREGKKLTIALKANEALSFSKAVLKSSRTSKKSASGRGSIDKCLQQFPNLRQFVPDANFYG